MAGLQYTVYSFDDSLANLPAGQIAFFNLSGFTLHGSIGERPVMLKAGPSISYQLRGDFIDLRFGTYFGDRFRQKIDDSIRLHDKLLLVLSRESVESEWVATEVESAIERERKTGAPLAS